MRYIFSILFLATTMSSLFGQTTIDTVKAYAVSYGLERENNKVTYKINDKKVDKTQYEQVSTANGALGNCNPCYVYYYDAEEKLVASGLYYGTCPTTAEEEKAKQEETEIGYESQTLTIKSNACYDGEWRYYDSDGKVYKTEFYSNGTLQEESND